MGTESQQKTQQLGASVTRNHYMLWFLDILLAAPLRKLDIPQQLLAWIGWSDSLKEISCRFLISGLALPTAVIPSLPSIVPIVPCREK
jgi:hypothetical protein